jgi:hypothetical protein
MLPLVMAILPNVTRSQPGKPLPFLTAREPFPSTFEVHPRIDLFV